MSEKKLNIKIRVGSNNQIKLLLQRVINELLYNPDGSKKLMNVNLAKTIGYLAKIQNEIISTERMEALENELLAIKERVNKNEE
ncbi:MAG: hypothetical protein N2645_20990 [Clostridia bacterium]|nr:hypothetical protein [Clostridia bacterium]